MSLQISTNINIDFYDNKYIMINAKQLDRSSRLVAVTCYNQGNVMNLNANNHSAYVRCKKADGHIVLNNCRINYKGEVLVELTEQMLAADGVCYVDLRIVEKGKAIVNIDTYDIITIDESPILSTMAFCINVYEATADNSLIESSYEYDGLNNLLQEANAHYSEVIRTSKSYAIGEGDMRDNEKTDNSKYYQLMSRSYAMGDTNNIRENENTDNSKYYMNIAKNHMETTNSYMNNAKDHMDTTKSYMDTTKDHMDTVTEYMNTTNGYMTKTNEYMNTTESYMNTTKDHMDTTNGYMEQTNSYMNTTKDHMDTTNEYMNTVNGYMVNTKAYMDTTESYMAKANEHMNDANSYMSTTSGYMEQTEEYMNNANEYMNNAKSHMDDANSYMGTTKSHMDTTNDYMEQTEEYMNNANEYMSSANEYMSSAESYMNTSESYMNNAKTSEDNAKESEINARKYYISSMNNSLWSQSYAMGGSEIRENEDIDNAKYYYTMTKNIYEGFESPFIPMGTISFSQLATAEKANGFLYNISDDFITDNTFKDGEGKYYNAGTSVYYTADGYWDCFGGITTATVDEIKDYLGI